MGEWCKGVLQIVPYLSMKEMVPELLVNSCRFGVGLGRGPTLEKGRKSDHSMWKQTHTTSRGRAGRPQTT